MPGALIGKKIVLDPALAISDEMLRVKLCLGSFDEKIVIDRD